MESRSNVDREKKVLNNTCPDEGDDFNFNPTDSVEAENRETRLLPESSRKHWSETAEITDEYIRIDFECRDVEKELPSLSTTTCKTENQPIVEKDKSKLKNFVNEKQPIILIKKGFNYDKNGQFESNLCHTSLASNEAVKSHLKVSPHIQEVHNSSAPFKCKICLKSFRRKRTLKIHINTVHEGNKPFKCDICEKSFSYKANLKSHVDTVHYRMKSFECDICRKSFGQKQSLSAHIKAVHLRRNPFKCDKCHKAFGYKNLLKGHIIKMHDWGELFQCKICHKSFRLKSSLRVHIKSVHNRNKPFQCDMCHKSFSIKGYLSRHINSVHNSTKPFKCEICHKSFKSKNYVNVHINASFGRKHHLQSHIITVHDDSAINKSVELESTREAEINTASNYGKFFQCDICRKSFTIKGNLYRHINTVHNNTKPFKCEICNKSFKYKGYGYFRQHFFNKKKLLTPNCMYCGHERDDAEHTFFHCVKWTARRQELESVYGEITPDNIIGVMLRDKETWTTFVVFIETVLKRKKADGCLRDK
ncbi:gastrula zinc finger protein XlCGF26.1-like [Trichogramma pretiosum]|uniref:gastrula zinc finger protein XlCGF26.1-like n=1 Tax=Trichogramma pretiosum TaxID=7493 RepID=UPI000C71A59D|nr:gastrula zinc finger protein XlCGF26.1-like [Trichogramma pretiosum]